MESKLLSKYNIPGPRYTSYPTVPYWQPVPPTEQAWLAKVNKTLQVSNQKEGISLYVHLPYCESLCTYCGCNKRITINHSVEESYIQAVLAEWQLYLQAFVEKPIIRDIHLGGGTPTFFSPANLRTLIEGLLEACEVHVDARFGFEAHPGNTTDEHLETLYELGFRRISIGVQDFDEEVLKAIHRYQAYEDIRHLTTKARQLGYTSVNYDLIYGLPYQTMESMIPTINKVIELAPDRIAFYSYAHIPSNKAAQHSFPEHALPSAATKLAIYELGKMFLEGAGYYDIGMDHFSLATDSLYKALKNGSLHRNFMGYTENNTKLLIGLGVSSISDAWEGFSQNEKGIEAYKARVLNGELPIIKGHELSHDDLVMRKHILNIMTTFQTSWFRNSDVTAGFGGALDRLRELELDGLVVIEPFSLRVTERGRAFVRNICMAFDERMWASKPLTQLFSQTI